MLGRLSALDDPGLGAVRGVISVTRRTAHTHFNVWERMKYHSRGVEACGNRLPRGRTPNEDVAYDAIFG